MPDLKIVGITGSYGKTSTKHYLNRILQEHFSTMMTPGSFNTTMGVHEWKVVIEDYCSVSRQGICQLEFCTLHIFDSLEWFTATVFGACFGIKILCVTLMLQLVVSPIVLLAANDLLKPVEKAINKKYYNEAASILASMPDLKIVGITGSYGKTSTKLRR